MIEINRILHASDAQSQFFLAGQLHPATALNTMTQTVRIRGLLDQQRLARALEFLCHNQAALRTRLEARDGEIEQVIEEAATKEVLLEIKHWSGDDAVFAEAVETTRQSVSLEGIHWKALLLRHDSHDHSFIICAHRCVWDEASMEIAGAELSAFYNRNGADTEEATRPAIDAQEEATAQGCVLEEAGSDGARRLATALANVPPLHAFPLKKPRPRFLSVAAASVDEAFDEETTRLLVNAARRWGITPFMIQAAGAAYILSQYCGQRRLAIGMPFSLRASVTDQMQVGSHTAMLPLAFDAEAALTFESLVRAFDQAYLAVMPNAGTPFFAIVRECGTRTDPSANPLFQIAFAEGKHLALTLTGCDCTPRFVSASPQQLDLFLQFMPDSLRVCYATHIISDGMAESLCRSVSAFLQKALSEPHRNLSSLPLLCMQEQDAFLAGLKRAEEPSFLGWDLYSLLSRYCTSSNRTVALICNGVRMTYAELLGVVDSIAGRLAGAGLGAQELVGICLPRSSDMVAAMLGVLRSGNAYVPLDPAFPWERLNYMVEHAQLRYIITTSELRSFFDGEGIRFIELDLADRTPGKAPGAAESPATDPAYVIYTSGSTGKPKGVAVSRGAVANFLQSMLQRPGIRREDTLCAVTTLSFDIAVLELLTPLCAGGTVVIATEAEARDPRRLAALLEDQRVTILQATPVTWQMLCASGWSGSRHLTALCGGEALAPALAQALLPRVGCLWNMYGPTETTIWSTCHRITDAELPVSVGTPIHNTTVYVLDEHQRPVPSGVEGQLFIGGDGVAVGYLHNEELTRQRFLPDPFRGTGRMYGTGDRARFDAAGLLYVVGRRDFQVKLRGFRIELGEIETRLSSFPGLEQVVAVVRRDDPENPELAAYFTLKPGSPEPTVALLRQHCSSTLPAYMVPSRFVQLDAFPLTPNGKVDRAALPRPMGASSPAPGPAAPSIPRSGAERALLDIWCSVLSLQTASVNDNFFELGGTSLSAFSVAQQIGRRFDIDLSVLSIFEHPTIAALAQFLKGSIADSSSIRDACTRARTRRGLATSTTAFDVAIVGAAGRFPGARNLEELWSNLCGGKETVTFFNREELDPLVTAQDSEDPHYIPARGILENVDLFDGAFFGISPNEAELMDPQQRVFMEVAWEAFENAGYVGEQIEGLVGVWAGMGNNFYYHYNVLTRPDKLAIMGEIAAEIANEKDHIAPRISHKLNLTGPSLSVHTACSTALVVVENAYQALVTHQVDVALAGGVDIRTPQKSGQRYEEGGVFSIDGHCRPFDAAATGTMFGEGVGAVVLKRLEDALRDNDTIYAVIKGAAVNHDGGRKVSYLAPSVEGQTRVIAAALAIGDVNPDTVTLIEAHGTGTPIGDPIEVEAMTRVFRAFTQRKGFCAIGSIKGNFGHATTAAGIAGVLKVVLALRNRKIPPTLHFTAPNPQIDFDSSPFFVNTRLIDWEPRGIPRRAGVSSFGFCGTNAHVVLEEAPPAQPSSPPARQWQLLLLSARSPKALDEMATGLAEALEGVGQEQLADTAYTSHVGRKRFEHRRCAVARTADEAAILVPQAAGSFSLSFHTEAENPTLAFMFPGQGSQYINMGLRLYEGEELFRETVDRCSTSLAPHLGCDLRAFLFPDPADAVRARQSLNNTFYTQPAIFTISYSLAVLMMHWGIQPEALIGHSIGEFVAATLGGVMELDAALRLVATRGRLMRDLPAGSMLSVRLPLDKLEGRLPRGVDLAAVNGPQLCVVAGPTEAMRKLSEELTAEGTVCRMLHTSHAFHSSMMDPIVEPFLRTVETVRLSPPRIPFVSTVTGGWVKPHEVTDPGYWARHLRSPVRFSQAVQVLLEDNQQVLVECGPRRTCTALALQHRPPNPGRVIATMPDSAEPDDEYPGVLLALGSLWLNGCAVDWDSFHRNENRRRIPLPSYPFQRRRYWIEPGNTATFGLDAAPEVRAATPLAVSDDGSDGVKASSGRDVVMTALVGLLEETLGEGLGSFDEDARFIALGFDSLLLTQLARIVRVRLGFEVSFRQLTERYSTPKLLADAVRTSRGGEGVNGGGAHPGVAPNVPAPSDNAVQQVPQAIEGLTRPASIVSHVAGARLGRDERGQPAWFVPDPTRPGKYLKVDSHA